MKRSLIKQLCLALYGTTILSAGSLVQAQQIAPFKSNDRVVFLGNSITDGGHYHSYIWLYYMTRFPEMNLRILNAGIGGDRVVEMVRRLDGDVLAKRPTVLLTTFGMNDTGYLEYNGSDAENFANQKVQESYTAFKQLEDRFKGLPETRIVLMGSSPYDETAKIKGNEPLRNKNKAMLRIVDFQRQASQANKWEFFDFNEPITKLNQQFQKQDSAFTLSGPDRIHPDNDGHMAMAYVFLKAQGFAGKKVADVVIDAKNSKVLAQENCSINNLKKIGKELHFDYLAASLPYPLDTIGRGWGSQKSQFQGTKYVPFIQEMNQERLVVRGLSGKYHVFIDQEAIGQWTAAELATGINLAEISKTPQYQQALQVMFLNEERWEIERRFREYAWVQFNFFQPKGLLDANNRKALEVLDAHKDQDGWLNAKRDLYSKAMHAEIRDAWNQEMELLITKMREIAVPQTRQVKLVPVL